MTTEPKKHILSKWSAKNGKGAKVIEAVESARDIVSSRMFMFFTFMTFPVLLISVSRTFETGWQPIFYLHTVFYFITVVIALFRRCLSITFRAVTMLIVMLVLGVADLLQYGLCGMGFLFLSIFCLNTPIMFGKKWGVTALCISIFSIALTAILSLNGTLSPSFDIAVYVNAPTSWLTAISVFSIFVALSVIGMARANEKQLNSIDSLERSETLHRNLLIEYKQAEEERKKAEEDRKKIEAQLRQSHKMESIGTLAGGIAHDFNNILSAVIGYSEMTLYEVEKGSVAEYNIQQISKAGKRAKELVNQILTFARKTDETKSPVTVGGIASEVLALLRSSFPPSINLETSINTNLIVIGNAIQLHQVFMNLCTNAFHAIENIDGIINVDVSDITICADNNPLPAGDYVCIRVSDTGSGMPPDIIPFIFEPYFTTKAPDKGTGMGLSVVHGIVKKHGGEIIVQSEHGKGATFTVYLPAIKTETIVLEHKIENIVECDRTKILSTDSVIKI
ncbi:MAG: hypothetical protein HQK73_06025 [Desulfamplus sp.]|nr:hypothetical protein [Desulfamplus sp.]MBF0412929.1 hypothetical protein [Desulfamplus sp.]